MMSNSEELDSVDNEMPRNPNKMQLLLDQRRLSTYERPSINENSKDSTAIPSLFRGTSQTSTLTGNERMIVIAQAPVLDEIVEEVRPDTFHVNDEKQIISPHIKTDSSRFAINYEKDAESESSQTDSGNDPETARP